MTTEDDTLAAESDTPVLDTLAAITAASIERSGLDAASFMAVRLAALAAVDAPAASYLLNLGPAVDAGLTLEDAQEVLIAVAPIIGTPRVVSASINLTTAFGLAIGIAESLLLEAELEAAEEGESALAADQA